MMKEEEEASTFNLIIVSAINKVQRFFRKKKVQSVGFGLGNFSSNEGNNTLSNINDEPRSEDTRDNGDDTRVKEA